MAEIVLGLGTSHTPMLFTPPEDWARYEERDRGAVLLDESGEPRTFDELVARGRGPKEVTLELATAAHESCQRQLDRLAGELEDAAPDAVLVIGDDQKELFLDENLPAVLIYWGATVESHHRPPRPGEPSWWSDALAQYYGRGRNESFPVASELARHLIDHLVRHDFDVAQSTALPRGRGEGHAFAFVHARLLDYRPVPVVPVFLNTYYPPNQPTPARCLGLGAALRDAVAAWHEPLRVAVVASGGLSHFVIDEALDRKVLDALREGEASTLASIPIEQLHSGTSEIRNWIAMHGATDHLSHAWSEYVPCYRTAAGTGTGCAFGAWR